MKNVPNNSQNSIGAKSNIGKATSLPCLYRVIAHENNEKECKNYVPNIENSPPSRSPPSSRRESAYILAESVEKVSRIYGIERLGFLTLTFKDHVTDAKEAQKRLGSLIRGVIKPRYHDYISVFERQKSGRIHFHLLVAMAEDIRTGVDFDAIKNRNYKSAGKYLRSEWKFWRDTAHKYRFGRTELLPVISSAEAIKYYVGKYISKSLKGSDDSGYLDKRVKLVRYSKGSKAGNTRFRFISRGSSLWRQSVGLFAKLVEQRYGTVVDDLEVITHFMGKSWAYKYKGFILSISDFIEMFPDSVPSYVIEDLVLDKFNLGRAIKLLNT